jgi:palmitoyltransferase
MAQQHDASGPPPANGAPVQPSSKSDTAAPKLNNEVELGNMPADSGQPDIMQLARVGDIAGMEKLFETGDYDATYTDDEGITPLHARNSARTLLVRSLANLVVFSGQLSTTSTPCANS